MFLEKANSMSCIYAFSALPQDRLADTDEYASLKHLFSSLCHVDYITNSKPKEKQVSVCILKYVCHIIWED